jgi:two-component system heavy metal sensor histidine kinase CusS
MKAERNISRSNITLTLRVSALFAAIACVVVSGLGMYLYGSVRQSLDVRADYTLIGRVEHFRNLMHDLYNVEQMEQRPALFESMMGNEQDVRIFRRQGGAPFIQSNPDHLVPPALTPVPVGTPLGISALHEDVRPDGVRVRWVSALAEVGSASKGSKDTVEIVAAYVMTQEAAMLKAYRWRVAGAAALAVLLTAALGFAVLRRGLQPLSRMSALAAQITPDKLATRFEQAGMPQELRDAAEAFNAMLDRLDAGYQHLSQFSGDLAHEIRTPVNVLMGQTQVALGRRRTPEEYEQLLESNVEELERLSRIIENILFLAQADHAALKVERTPLALADELKKVADYFEGVADERGMHFELEADGICQANLVMWRRAVSNLMVNAVRYGDSGSAVRISAHADAGGSHIRIDNRNAEMTPQALARVFDRFYRGDQSRSAFTESNGLGLAIVKAIMALHGGSATASCPQPGWVRFELSFPASAASAISSSTSAPT